MKKSDYTYIIGLFIAGIIFNVSVNYFFYPKNPNLERFNDIVTSTYIK